MFFSFAEKRRGGLSGKWHLRQVAFDTRRRHLYVSEAVTTLAEVAPPHGFPEPFEPSLRSEVSVDTLPNVSPVRSGAASPSASVTPRTSGRPGTSEASALSCATYDRNVPADPASVTMTTVWKRKLKVDLLEVVAHEERVIIEDSHNREKDFFELSFYGESRKLEPEERPAQEPLLCPSAGLGGAPARHTSRNLECVRDPKFLVELHQALQDEFDTLRVLRDTERERRRLEGQPSEEEFEYAQNALRGYAPNTQQLAHDAVRLTLPSPRNGRRPSKTYRDSLSYRCKISLRFRNEYEFMRFRYVVSTVLGYDRLCSRPYRGLPPYDPRNGVVFAQLPMLVWHNFRTIEKAIFYTFLRGDLVGRTTKGELAIIQRGVYLCITHDLVMVLRESCSILRWCRLQDMGAFEYNSNCHKPYVAFLTDPGASDIVFVPRPPFYGVEAMKNFNPRFEVLRILEIMRAVFYASLDIRRAIRIQAAPEYAVRSFAERVERELGCGLNFDPPVLYLGSESTCDLPKERPADAWRAVQAIYAHQDMQRASHTAVPLYEGHPNSSVFEPEELHEMEHQMERERVSQYDVVGMREAAQEALRRAIREGRLRPSGSSSRTSRRSGMDSEEDKDIDPEHPYGPPDSHYLTAEEVAALEPQRAKGSPAIGNPKTSIVEKGVHGKKITSRADPNANLIEAANTKH